MKKNGNRMEFPPKKKIKINIFIYLYLWKKKFLKKKKKKKKKRKIWRGVRIQERTGDRRIAPPLPPRRAVHIRLQSHPKPRQSRILLRRRPRLLRRPAGPPLSIPLRIARRRGLLGPNPTAQQSAVHIMITITMVIGRKKRRTKRKKRRTRTRTRR